MSEELIKSESNAVSVISGNEISDIMKPLIREIYLFDSFVAGTMTVRDGANPESVIVGDEFSMIREDSRFDDNAIALYTSAGKKIGFIPERDNVVFARLMDAGKLLKARVGKVEKKGSFIQISIGIYMVDF